MNTLFPRVRTWKRKKMDCKPFQLKSGILTFILFWGKTKLLLIAGSDVAIEERREERSEDNKQKRLQDTVKSPNIQEHVIEREREREARPDK